ncbi:GNAT family N-acetyltransferase [Haloarchaeobius sp. HRN-SO-5]|uniref:GNAT family N-acetyltransferase n=1 Tax=Haloarchaeobius sp. HRN-SO-5 TaxID=3446118 RepID=UPI003EBC7750
MDGHWGFTNAPTAEGRMAVDVVRLDGSDLDEWNALLERSPQATPFHLLEALRVAEDHSGTTLHPLVGYKGEEPVGLFPIFEQRRGPLTFAFSPPPNLFVDYLGPALVDPSNLKRRKRDKRNKRFVDACFEWAEDEFGPKYVNVRSGFQYQDPRPFVWKEFDVETKYTYTIDLDDGVDEIRDAFSGDARRRIRAVRDADHDVDVSVGDDGAARRIVDHLAERLDSMGVSRHVPPEFVVDLYDRLPDGTVRPYVCRLDGEFVGGILTLESHDTVYAWQGGAKPDAPIDLNEYIDWRIIQDGIDRGNSCYDIVGAESPRLCWYKAKFGPDLQSYHVATRSSTPVTALSELYKRVRDGTAGIGLEAPSAVSGVFSR